MTDGLSRYRSLWRRIGRLPLDVRSLDRLKVSVRTQFRSKTRGYSADYHSLSTTIDSILVQHKYTNLQLLLDLVYKASHVSDPWKLHFVNVRYNRWKPVWPLVHLIEEFASEKHLDKYKLELSRQEPVQDFSFVQELGLDPPKQTLTPLKHRAPESELEPLMKEMKKFHEFLGKNASALLQTKLRPFEVIYEPTRFGIPPSVAFREYLLRTKITYMKSLVSTYRPITKNDLDRLVLVATDNSTDALNPVFFRYMRRTYRRLSPLELKYLVLKQLVPNNRNIRFWYREYVMKQFYQEDGAYVMSPMENFYA